MYNFDKRQSACLPCVQDGNPNGLTGRSNMAETDYPP